MKSNKHSTSGVAGAGGALIAALECATPSCGAALAGMDGVVTALRWRLRKARGPVSVVAELQGLMADAGATAADIGAVAVSNGPGAFTGTRAGLAVAKALAHAWGVPLHAVSTLEALAWRLPIEGPPVCALLDARRGELYCGWYAAGEDGVFTALRPDAIIKFEDVLEAANACAPCAVRFTGDGATLHREALQEALGERALFAPSHLERPAADGVARAAAARIRAGAPGVNPLAAVPAYLRASDAEINHAAAQASAETTA